MLAFHSEPSLKSAVMDRLREHRRLDQIVQGVYFENGKGCHLGCLTHFESNTHDAAARLFGIEPRIGYWLEAVFEGLPKGDCERWVLESTEAIPCGADLSLCHHHLSAWLLGESGFLKIVDENRDAIEQVRGLHVRAASGEVITADEWSAAMSAARSAAWSAAESAAWNEIAAKSIEIFAAAPVHREPSQLSQCVADELCARRLWCGDSVKVLA